MTIALMAAAIVAAIDPDAPFPAFHGEITPLRIALGNVTFSRLIDGHVWVSGDLAAVVQLLRPWQLCPPCAAMGRQSSVVC